MKRPARSQAHPPEVEAVHALSLDETAQRLESPPHGLALDEVLARRVRHGENALPQPEPPGLLAVFVRQFLSPLIYILLIAAVVSLLLGEHSDAFFIFAVLMVNAIIGTTQEYSAEKSASSLRQMITSNCRVTRAGEAYEISASELVPGDRVWLEPGGRVPADIRLATGRDLAVDESLLTGESLAVEKDPTAMLDADAPLGDRINMAFAGSMIARGYGTGVVTATGLDTELGRIASAVLGDTGAKAPLVIRMEAFTARIAALVGGAVLIMAAAAYSQGAALEEIFLLAVALAVSAIPEGLPVALTVALAIGMSRMAKRNVIVRRLVAMEALGSCTYIASDKTGTLTVNELTVRRVALPGVEAVYEVTGEGAMPEGALDAPVEVRPLVERLGRAAVLANDGFFGLRNGVWTHHGDAVDVALLVFGHKIGIGRAAIESDAPQIGFIPFTSEQRYAASLNRIDGGERASVKGALERLLPMCSTMVTPDGERPLDPDRLVAQVEALAAAGYRVLALADGPVGPLASDFAHEDLSGLCLLGLVGMIDPLRPEVKAAVAACRDAGIEVCMVTGDHPLTASVIAAELGLSEERAITGAELRHAFDNEGEPGVDRLTQGHRVFARVEPQQKLDIVDSLGRQGHFVAVTGDGANDAPALKAAHVGVAMGQRGTDVARETSDLIITDDNFASIVAGVEEGRVAYGNVRKVIFLLISTGAAELVLFTLALLTGLPLPLTAVQLLWLNLVTNGIQDVALAFEPGEGDELERPPRSPREPIFDRVMIERTLLSAAVMGVATFLVFEQLIAAGVATEAARNAALLLMVLFENVHVFNSRSETRLAIRHSGLRNPLLLGGTLLAQCIHILAMYTPGLSGVLGVEPVSFGFWLSLLGVAMSVLVVMELHKMIRFGAHRRPPIRSRRHRGP